MFFRIGGPHVGKATLSLVVNSDNVDHRRHLGLAGRPRRRRQLRLDVNTADTGLIVNGDNVTATGLFVEHYQKYNVIWNGENGKTIFFQNETAVRPAEPGGLAARRRPRLRRVQGGRLGQDPRAVGRRQLHLHQRRPVDPRRPRLRGAGHAGRAAARPADRVSCCAGTIDHVVNDTGAAAQGTATVPVNIVSFP